MFKQNDWVVGTACILLGAFVIYRSSFWQEMTSLDPGGPGWIPTVLAWGIIIIGVIHLVGWWFAAKGTRAESEPSWLKEVEELKPVLQIILVSTIYIFVIRYVGYLLATPLLLAAILRIVKERRLGSILLTSLGGTLILFVVFYYGLKVKLPLGIMKALF